MRNFLKIAVPIELSVQGLASYDSVEVNGEESMLRRDRMKRYRIA